MGTSCSSGSWFLSRLLTWAASAALIAVLVARDAGGGPWRLRHGPPRRTRASATGGPRRGEERWRPLLPAGRYQDARGGTRPPSPPRPPSSASRREVSP